MSEGEAIAQHAVSDVTTHKKPTDWLEVIATVLLGVAAVLIAWSTYQSQLWGGVQDTRNTASALMIVDAADDLGRADSMRSLDQLLFGDYILRPDEDEADLLLSQMSDEGRIASERWFVTEEARPFDGDAYTLGVYGEGIAKRDAAFVLFDRAAEANQNGDDYVLASTIVALVLFLSGVSLVLKGRRTRFVLVTSSGVIIAFVALYIASLPLAGGADSEEEISVEATEASITELNVSIEAAELADAEALARAAEEAPVVDDDAAPEVAAETDPFVPTQGGAAFAVYIEAIPASASSGDLAADFAEEFDFFEAQGVPLAAGGIDCDEGALEGLGLDAGEYVAVAAYFETSEDAATFVTAFELPPESIVEVRTFCLD